MYRYSVKRMNDHDTKHSSRNALLQSAEQLFTQKGYSAVSTRELAEHAQVNLGAINYHFGSKANLFIETVRSLMSRREDRNRFLAAQVDCCDQDSAVFEICTFIKILLSDMCQPSGPDMCRMMCREIHGSTSEDPELYVPLVNSFVDEFIKPLDQRLCSLIRQINPKKEEQEVFLTAQSIIGQCAFYVSHKPFLERLRNISFKNDKYLNQVIEHIARFSLLALGCKEEQIASAIAKLFLLEKK